VAHVDGRALFVRSHDLGNEEIRLSADRDDRRRPRRPRLEPTPEVANLILRRILIASGIFLGGFALLFCFALVVMLILTGGFFSFLKSGGGQPSPPAATKPATTLKK
jgi:hypothetical protein